MKWKHIEFINGGNPYISRTEDNFSQLAKKYYLIRVKENFYVSVCEKAENYFWVSDLPQNLQNNLIDILQKYNYEIGTIDNILSSKLKDIHLCY